MRAISATTSTTSTQSGATAGPHPDRSTTSQPAGRALIVAAAPPDGPGSTTTADRVRSRADFLAQLIATASGLPQTREKRRAEPGDAVLAYEAGTGTRHDAPLLFSARLV